MLKLYRFAFAIVPAAGILSADLIACSVDVFPGSRVMIIRDSQKNVFQQLQQISFGSSGRVNKTIKISAVNHSDIFQISS